MRMMRGAGRRAGVGAAVMAAAALALTGCGGASDADDRAQSPVVETSEAATFGAEEPEGEQFGAETSAPAPTTSEDSPPPEDSEDLFGDAARTTSWASDEAMDIDEDGNGTIPAASLEADLVDLFANKFDMSVKEAKCAEDMSVTDWYGFETCDVVDEEMTYFGTVELIDHKDGMVRYEVMFPGIDKGDVDF